MKCGQTNGRTDGHYETYRRSSRFCEHAWCILKFMLAAVLLRWPALQWHNWYRTGTFQHSLPLPTRSFICPSTFRPLKSILNIWNTFHISTDYCLHFKFHIVFSLQSLSFCSYPYEWYIKIHFPDNSLNNGLTHVAVQYLTYLLHGAESFLRSWPVFAANQEISRILWNPKVLYCTHKCPLPVPSLSQLHLAPTTPSNFLNIHLNIILPSTSGSPQWPLSLRFPHQHPVHPLSSPIRATCPAHLIHLDFTTRTILGKEYRSFSSSLCNFLHSPVTSSLLGPNTLLNTLFSNTLSLRSSLNVSDQVSHPYKTTDNIIVLHILIFKFLDSNLEDKRFKAEVNR
jgi:hypothetical protein